MRAHKGEMKVTSAELRSKIERYRELIRSLGAKNLARGRLQTLIDKMEKKLRKRNFALGVRPRSDPARAVRPGRAHLTPS